MEQLADIRWVFAVAGVILVIAAALGDGLEIRELKIPKLPRSARIISVLIGAALVALAVVVPGGDNRETVELRIASGGSGTTDPSPGIYLYDEGSIVTITAKPDSGYELDYWSGGLGKTSSIILTVSEDISITAYFKEKPTEQFSITIGKEGNGTTDPSPGTYLYDEGSTLSIESIPDFGYELDYWSGDYGTSSTLDITVREDTVITAYFKPLTVIFVDPNLESIIRETINKFTGTIYASDLISMTKLEAIDKGISDLSGLEFCVNLEELSFWNNNINIISPLAGLTNLKELSLAQNHITYIDALANLTSLKYLSLWENEIRDISALTNLTNLQTLRMWDNDVSDISPLSNLRRLDYLALSNNNITDINPLAGLTNLSSLGLSDNSVADIQALVENQGLSTGDSINLRNLPLNSTSLNYHIPTLQARGVEIIR
jgi:internalin A